MTVFEPYNFQGDFTSHSIRRFLVWATEEGASDILIQGGDFIWLEIHGRQMQGSTQRVQQGNLSQLIAGLWSPEVESTVRSGRGADRSLELSERDGLEIPRGVTYRYRCNIIQARVAGLETAYAITMRTIPHKLPRLEDQGLPDELRNNLYPSMGLGLICGPTGSGKTTLLAAMYRHAGESLPDRKVITYEDPIEYILGGPHWKGPQPAQSEIGRDVQSFALGLKNALRRKPSIIGIGEARDLETMDAMIEVSLTGQYCLSTMHTESAAETISRCIQAYPVDQQNSIGVRLLGTLRFVCVQRLLKTTDGKRAPVREFVIFDREVRKMLEDHPCNQWAALIRQKLESEGKTMADQAWKMLQDARIDAREYIELAGYAEYERRSAT